MKLNSLELRNFKGIKQFKMTPEGNNLDIFGDNGTGKTTVFDAFMWLLFDKDSSDSSNFNIKTLDKSGQVMSGLEHEVKGIIEVNGKTIELQKIYKEKWTKRRGETEQTLTGHTTEHAIDGVPKKKKEYTELLEGIIDEETFRILTNPLHFNTNLEWKKRREVAMDLVEQIESKEILNANEKLKGLEELLTEDMTAEDLKAKTTATKRKLNEKIKQVPVRIDEISRQDIDEDIVFEGLEKVKEKLESEIKALKDSSIDTSRVNELKEEVTMLETWKRTFERDKTLELNETYKNVNKKLQVQNNICYKLSDKEQKILNTIQNLENDIKASDKMLKHMRSKYEELFLLEFNIDDNTCKSCGQDLQEEKKEENLEKFEKFKQSQLKQNTEEGKAIGQEKKNYISKLDTRNKELIKNKEEILQAEKDKGDLNVKLNEIEEKLSSIDFNEFKEYKNNEVKIQELNKEIDNILEEEQTKSQKHQDKLNELEKELSNTNVLLAKKKVIEANLKRVEELKEEERELAEQIAQLEKIEMQCEQFIITKAELLEDKLNNKFKLVKFKLFNKQVNGGVDETFVTTVDGVPFEDLNNAMRINAGLDIISTLTEHYNFRPTIFIDNRESVNQIVDIDSQIINLIVSEDEKLTVRNKKTKEVA